jgi:molybdopterin molybdotransferase
MISVDEALNKILSHIRPLGSEKVSLLDALGRVIAEDICAPRDIPPFDNSGMDGTMFNGGYQMPPPTTPSAWK